MRRLRAYEDYRQPIELPSATAELRSRRRLAEWIAEVTSKSEVHSQRLNQTVVDSSLT
jgi:hypothetical protein